MASNEKILAKPANLQGDSPLFKDLPGEIRSQIFALALTDYPDPAPDRSTTTPPVTRGRLTLRRARLTLSCCVPVEPSIENADRAPPEYDVWDGPQQLANTVERAAKQQGRQDIEIDSIRVFAQMWRLESGDLANMMSTRHLHPRKLTLTIRHADWWYWENDEPLRFEGNWIQDFCLELPSSLQQICIELESLERKKEQVDKIADQMVQRWFFKNLDGVVFLADTTPAAREVTRWSGSSTWHRQRWVRDETEPGRIDYYVVAITFKPWTIIERNGGKVSEDAKYAGENDTFDEVDWKLHLPGQSSLDDAGAYLSGSGDGSDGSDYDSDYDSEEEYD
ncbi:hypothetical protein NM208_g1855 [Fusarium decemcellulare]|uniref:Uncharacterized protein n=1 Tax=Fusarium decemcellulare TaxID=57161 RepID=A0ACC1SUR6_9HYPO|nr:hypothetical protein NM208_g1855 [Fusarium decemcellulare]